MNMSSNFASICTSNTSSQRYNRLSMVTRNFDDVLEQLLDCVPFTVAFQYLYIKLKFKDVLLPFLFITYKGNVN